MQNKKLLSVCLVLALLCTCIAGVLMISANAATTVTWKVTGTNNAEAGEFATFNEAIAAAEAKAGEWLGTDELVIDLSAVAKQKFVYTDGLLFGVHTIFPQDHTKLPLTMTGGEFDVSVIPLGNDSTRTSMTATNDYTFKDIIF